MYCENYLGKVAAFVDCGGGIILKSVKQALLERRLKYSFHVVSSTRRHTQTLVFNVSRSTLTLLDQFKDILITCCARFQWH